MTAFRLTFDRNGNPTLEEDAGGVYTDERDADEFGWCRAEDAAEWIEQLLAPAPSMEGAA